MRAFARQTRRLALCAIIVLAGAALEQQFGGWIAAIGTAATAGLLYFLNGHYEESQTA